MKAKKWVTFITAGISAVSLICASCDVTIGSSTSEHHGKDNTARGIVTKIGHNTSYIQILPYGAATSVVALFVFLGGSWYYA